MITPKSLTTHESLKLLEGIKNTHYTAGQFLKAVRNHLMTLLMLDTGLRVGELVQLLVTDFILLNEVNISLYVRPEIAKNKRARTVPLSPRVRGAIENMPPLSYCSTGVLLSPWMFYTRSTLLPLSKRQVERIVHAAGMKHIGRPVNPHMLRHTFATRLMQITSVRTVQELLGHKHLSSTQIYTHPSEEDKSKAIAQLS